MEIGPDGNLLADPAGAGKISFPPTDGEEVPG